MNLPRHISATGRPKKRRRGAKKLSAYHRELQRDAEGRFRPMLSDAQVENFIRSGHSQAQIARALGVSREAVRLRIRRLVEAGALPAGAGRKVCGECGRPLPPAPEISRAARQLRRGKRSPLMNRLASAKKPLDNGERQE